MTDSVSTPSTPTKEEYKIPPTPSTDPFVIQLEWVTNGGRPSYLHSERLDEEHQDLLAKFPDLEQYTVERTEPARPQVFIIRKDDAIVKEMLRNYQINQSKILVGEILGYLCPGDEKWGVKSGDEYGQWRWRDQTPKEGSSESLYHLISWHVKGHGRGALFSESYDPLKVSLDDIKTKLELLRKTLPGREIRAVLRTTKITRHVKVETLS